jgi:uncharacterized protein YndB with AHSA1/START domain
METTSKPKFVYVTYIATTPEKLWEALTSGDFTGKYWFGSRIQSEWKVGSPFRIQTGVAANLYHRQTCRRQADKGGLSSTPKP